MSIKVLITGAAGNLGGLLAAYLNDNTDLKLNLLIHQKDVESKLRESKNVEIFRGDLNDKSTIQDCLETVDVVIHFAGVLFKGKPESFLPTTNTQYFKNLCDVAVAKHVKRIILISFPHVEGETTPENPATGRLDGTPESVHARTRLVEEKYLLGCVSKYEIETVSLRVGMVYGSGILMIDTAKWLASKGLLGIWKKKTWIHLISKDDFLEISKVAIIKDNINGIYHIGDEGTQTLQEFFEIAVSEWGHRRLWIMPEWMIFTFAWLCEIFSLIFNTRAILTRDFIKIGMASYYGDTSRMKQELTSQLKYPTFDEGKVILKDK